MALRLLADRADEIPEALRKGAVEKSGQWLADLGTHSVEDVGSLKEGLVAERQARKKLDGMLKSFGWTLKEDGSGWANEGLDPTSARDAVEKIRSGSMKGSDEIERYKQTIQAKLEGDRAKMQTGIDKLKEQLRQAKVVEPIRNAIKEHGGSVNLLAPVIEKAARVEIDDDFNVSIALLNERGQPMLTKKSGSTDPMGFDEFVQDLRKHPDYRAAFAGMGAGGSGIASQSGGSARVVKAGGDVSQMSPRELIGRGNEYAAPRGT